MVKLQAKPRQDRTCCGVIQDAKYRVRQRKVEPDKAQPWIALKFAVGLTAGLIGYAGYVYVGRFCVPMILRQQKALGGRVMGVVFLVAFSIFAFMIIWTYIMVVVISPGFAKDYITTTPYPIMDGIQYPLGSYNSANGDIGAGPYETSTVAPSNAHTYTHSETIRHEPSHSHQRSLSETSHHSTSRAQRSLPANNPEIAVSDVMPPVHAALHPSTDPAQASSSEPEKNGLPSTGLTRMPPNIPVLLPQHRYCMKDERLKPPRAHHCRACGTCVLKYDHHCPWIGQCVGARNQKFFVNFLMWACLFCLWIFTTMLGLNVRAGSNPNFNIDVQEIVILAISGLFSLFTAIMLVGHIRMICLNQTTVESLQFQFMKETERGTMGNLHAWYQFAAKAETKRQWDQEWGRIDTDGNLWWLGSSRKNWESVMGERVWWWLLPIGRSASDGLSYPTNPRFDEQGRWKPRKYWPRELQ